MRLLLTLFLILNLAAAENIVAELYKIEKPDRALITEIERNGGRVSRFRPGEFAELHLDAQLVEKLRREGVVLHKLTADTAEVYRLSGSVTIDTAYHSYDGVSAILDSLAALYPEMCRLESIGRTVQGREIWAMRITDLPELEEPEPEVRYIGTMHGNEIIAQELLLYFIDELLSGYEQDDRLRELIDSTDIWIVPNMNFDGTAEDQRFNANGVDLNRDFPDREFDMVSDTTGREPETKAVMRWSEEHHFVLAANFHSGALVVNYPWDKNLTGTGYAASPDDATFRRIALGYSILNEPMYNSSFFEQGITNGAAWYETSGSMQDWNYNWLGCMEVTIEVSDIKAPDPRELTRYWNDNRESMIALLEQVHTGIRGTIRDASDGTPLAATIRIRNNQSTVQSDPNHGDFYRLLEAGNYDVIIEHDGYLSHEIKGVQVAETGYVVLDVALTPEPRHILTLTVRDSANGSGMSGTLFEFYQAGQLKQTAVTGDNGNLEVLLTEGVYTLIISRDGYFTITDTIDLQTDLSRSYGMIAVIPAKLYGTIRVGDRPSASGTVVYCQGKTDTVGLDNRFHMEGLYPGEVHLFAHLAQHQTAHIDTSVLNGDSLELVMTLVQGQNAYTLDFESSDGSFRGEMDWEYGAPLAGPLVAHSGSKVWGTGLNRDYADGPALNSLQTPLFSILEIPYPLLEFYQWYETEEYYDGCNLKISADEGQTWEILRPQNGYPLRAVSTQFENPMGGQPAFSGERKFWEKVSFDLSAYAATPFLMFRFDLGADQEKGSAGWFIDDFRIMDGNATGFAIGTEYADDDNVRIFPNPANAGSRIRVQVQGLREVDIRIVNILGQLIRSERIASEGHEILSWTWDSTADSGRPVSSGIYFLRIESGNYSGFHKLIILK
jgi:hypothetical protein